MLNPASKAAASRTRVEVLTVDAAFERTLRDAFSLGGKVDLNIVSATLAEREDSLGHDGVTVVVVDIEGGDAREMAALERLAERLAGWPPLVVVTSSFDKESARRFVQMRVADFLVKPVQPAELVRSCARVVQAPKGAERVEAEIYTYVPAIGGAGVTTLAIQTALLLLGSGITRRGRRPASSTSTPARRLRALPRPRTAARPHRDRAAPGAPRPAAARSHADLSRLRARVMAAPNRPAEMRTFDPEIVTRLLDLASSHFKYVVIDMPRTWFPWTDSVLLGSNRLFIVCEMTVPGFKHAKQLVAAIKERLATARIRRSS
jgi:pilus assembly protein CpaE